METKEQVEALNEIRSKIENVKIAMLVTEEPDGTLRSRPMGTNKMDEDGNLWFFTNEFSPKVAEVNQNHKVNISYADVDDNLYVSVSGNAHLITDKKKIDELWKPHLKAWFPEGKEDPNVALLKVTPQKAEYWNASSSKMVMAFNIAKAIVSGEKHRTKDHKKLDL